MLLDFCGKCGVFCDDRGDIDEIEGIDLNFVIGRIGELVEGWPAEDAWNVC